MDSDARTYENEDSLGIVLPLFDLLLVFNICSLTVHGEERSGAVPGVGFSLRWLIRRITAIIYSHLEVKRWE
jgi:hypothetical protein